MRVQGELGQENSAVLRIHKAKVLESLLLETGALPVRLLHRFALAVFLCTFRAKH